MPGLSKRNDRDPPASYNPRSNRLPSNNENTLWKNGSLLGKSTSKPAGSTRRCGSKVLFFWTSVNFLLGRDTGIVPAAGCVSATGVSQTATSAALGAVF